MGKLGWQFLTAALAAFLFACLAVTQISASVSEDISSAVEEIVRTGEILRGDVGSERDEELERGRREAARRLAHLGLTAGCSGDDLRELQTPLLQSDLALITAHLYGYPGTDAGEAAAYLRERNFPYLTEDYDPDGHADARMFAVWLFPQLSYGYGDPALAAAVAPRAFAHLSLWEGDNRQLFAGDGAKMLYRLLLTADRNGRLLAERLVFEGVLREDRVAALLLAASDEETDRYVWDEGLEPEAPQEGYYILSPDGMPEICLNALMDGADTDRDGLGVTVWRNTADMSQTFRLDVSAEGIVRVYCAASKGGYNRMLGITKKGTLALYRGKSQYAASFRFIYGGGGIWYMEDTETGLFLSVPEGARSGTAVSERPLMTEGYRQGWRLQLQGAVDEDGFEAALYPSMTLRITQGAYDVYSHGEQNAIDIMTDSRRVYAPFTGTVVRIIPTEIACNAVFLESNAPVLYADGSIDYMTIILMHDDYIGDLHEGDVIRQGQYFYDMGVAGNAVGPHVHVAVVRGRCGKNYRFTGSGNEYAENAFFLLPGTVVYNGYGLQWKYWNGEED